MDEPVECELHRGDDPPGGGQDAAGQPDRGHPGRECGQAGCNGDRLRPEASTTYSYALFAHNATPAYAKPATVTTATLTGAAPAPVTGVKVSAVTSTSVMLAWTNPSSAQFTGVMIRRAAGKTAPASPTAGTLVANPAKPAATVTDTGLKASTTYSYALFAHNSVPAYAAVAAVTTTTTAAAPPGVAHVSGALGGNTTWSPAQASAYIIDSTLDIPKGVTLTIDPGTVIKALNDGLTVEGSLSAVGTSGSPIVFTFLNDNSVGGDTGSGSRGRRLARHRIDRGRVG
jgi:hypothetical protein